MHGNYWIMVRCIASEKVRFQAFHKLVPHFSSLTVMVHYCRVHSSVFFVRGLNGIIDGRSANDASRETDGVDKSRRPGIGYMEAEFLQQAKREDLFQNECLERNS